MPFYDWCRAARDYYFARVSLQRRVKRTLSRAEEKLNILFWVSFDIRLPLRWQCAHKLDQLLWHHTLMPLSKLEGIVKDMEVRYNDLEHYAGLLADNKDVYRQVNTIIKPLLKRHGFRSLAEFEHAFETHGANMAWPKALG